MKILLVDKQDAGAGVGTYSTEAIRSLTAKGHTVIPLRFGLRRQPSDPRNTVILPYFLSARKYYLIPKQKTLGLIRSTIIKEKPDIIHLSLGVSSLDFYIPRLARQMKIPTVGIIHAAFSADKITLGTLGSKSLLISYLPCLKSLDRALVFSQKIADFLISNGVSASRIRITPNAVDTNLFHPGPSRFKKQRNITFAFLFFGRLDREKNPDKLIESFLKIKPPVDQKLLIVGKSFLSSMEKTLKKKYGRHPQIIFTGPIINSQEKIDIIRAADVFVLPSSFEGMSFSLLETMACGLAPVVSNVGNHDEVIGDSGILIDHEKIKEQLPIALQVFSKNPSLGKVMGKKARKIVAQKYNLEKQTSGLINIYQELLAKDKRQTADKSFWPSFLRRWQLQFLANR